MFSKAYHTPKCWCQHRIKRTNYEAMFFIGVFILAMLCISEESPTSKPSTKVTFKDICNTNCIAVYEQKCKNLVEDINSYLKCRHDEIRCIKKKNADCQLNKEVKKLLHFLKTFG